MITQSKRPHRLRERAAACLLAVGLASLCLSTPSAQQGWRAEQRGVAGKDLNAVYFADSKRGWVAGDDGLVFRTTDAGRTWSPQSVGTDASINDIYFRNKEDGYLLAGSSILVTEDGGETWRTSQQFTPKQFGGALPELYSVRFTGKKKGWIVGSVSRRDVVVDSLLLSTTDGGASWVRQRAPVSDELIHLDFAGDKRGWIVGTKGVILYTADGGASWARQRSGTNATLYHVDFDDGDLGWAVGERGTILRTEDGGQTWTKIDMPTLGRTTLLSVGFINEDEGWIVGRGGTILRSGDGGRTWTQQESGSKQNLYALFAGKKNCWAVGGDGMVLQYER